MNTQTQKGSIELTPEMIEKIKSALQAKQWSVYRLQQETGFSYVTLNHLVNHKKTSFNRKKVETICKILGIIL